MMLLLLAVLGPVAIGWGLFELLDDDDSGSGGAGNGADADDAAAEGEEAATKGTDMLAGSGDDDRDPGNGDEDTRDNNNVNNRINGSDGDNVINSTGGRDLIEGKAGNDEINGNGWHDTIGGGAGHDTIDGGSGKDVLLGNDGNDSVSGGAWHDALAGGNGDDLLSGGDGNDTLHGGLIFPDGSTPGNSGSDISAEFASALNKFVNDDPETIKPLFKENQTYEELVAALADRPEFKGIELPDSNSLMVEEGTDTLEGDKGNDKLSLGPGDHGIGGGGKDVFHLAAEQNGHAAVIEDYDAGQDRIEVAYDAAKGEPAFEVQDRGSDAVVMADKVEVARVLNAAGKLSSEDIVPVPVTRH